MVAELRVVKVAQFSHFGPRILAYFPHTKGLPRHRQKSTFLVRGLQPIGLQPITSQNDYDFFRVVVKSPKIWQRGFLATSATCPDFRL